MIRKGGSFILGCTGGILHNFLEHRYRSCYGIINGCICNIIHVFQQEEPIVTAPFSRKYKVGYDKWILLWSEMKLFSAKKILAGEMSYLERWVWTSL